MERNKLIVKTQINKEKCVKTGRLINISAFNIMHD